MREGVAFHPESWGAPRLARRSPAVGERRQTRRLYILSVSMCSVVYTTSAAWVRHCAGLFATRVAAGKTAPARRFPAARLDDWIAGFGRPLTAGQLTAWFRAWPGSCFRGPVGQTRRGVATAAGTLGGLENAVLARSTFSPLSATPRFARQGAGAAHGPVGLCGGWCPWGECVRGGILSFPCGYYRSAAQSFILLKFPAHFALPLPRLFHVLHRPCHHLRLRPRRQEPLDPLPLPPASPPRAAPCSTTRIH